MKQLYKYPQGPFPYADLVETSRRRGRHEFEYELLDTGVFDDDRYWDVFVEYAKAAPEDILILISVHNRGPEPAHLHVLPTLWFRNQWSWHGNPDRPTLERSTSASAGSVVRAVEATLGERFLFCEGDVPLLFTENETNTQRIFGVANRCPYVKDSINDFIVHGREGLLNPEQIGTKVAAHYQLEVGPGQCLQVRLRLSDRAPGSFAQTNGNSGTPFGSAFDRVIHERRNEADEFYAAITPKSLDADAANVMRQALAGMLWSKQFYLYDVDKWLEERGSDPFKATHKAAPRNEHWHHMFNGDVISMPDKWEYPWYAAWDLAFHVLALTLVDPDFGKQQLRLMLRERYMHPNGQIPAYEWNFGDVNPPVHAWSTIFTYRLEKAQRGEGDREWLKSCFQKLLLNFTWWVNRKDRSGRNVFEGGFLGLDNIGVFDRSAPLPTGGYLEQADGTAWMALFCQNMLEIAVELAPTDPDYEDMALKFSEHFLWIASAMGHLGQETGMWDEEDGFYYDVLRLPDGRSERLKVRSMVGLLPLCATTIFEGDLQARSPEIAGRFESFLAARPELAAAIHDPLKLGVARPAARFHPERDPAAAGAGEDARRARVLEPLRHPLALALPCRPPLSDPGRRPGIPRRLSAGGVGYGDVRRQLELARTDLDAGQCPDYPGPAPVLPLLRQRFHRRMSHRLRPEDEPLSSGRGDRASAGRHLPERSRWSASGPWRHPEVPGGPALARLPAVL